MSSPVFVHLTLLLLAIGLSERSLGPHGDRLSSLLALAAVIPPLLSLFRGRPLRSAREVALVLPVLAGALGFMYLDGTIQYFSLAAAFAWVAVLRRADRQDPATLLAWTAFGFAVFTVARDHLTLWPFFVTASERISTFVTTQVGSPAPRGPSYSGLWPAVAFLIAIIGILFLHRPHPARVISAFLLFVLAVPAGLAIGTLAPIHVHGWVPGVLLGWRMISFVLLLIPLALLTLRGTPLSLPERSAANRRGVLAVWVAATVSMIGLGLLTWSIPVTPGSVRVLLDTRGSFNLTPLEWGRYGSFAPQGASLATLPPILETFGFELATHDTTIEPSDLSDRDVLVVMNPTEPYSQAEHDAIWKFVESGGGLLVLGDHTDIMGTMGPTNELLEPSGIRLNFDSAIPLVERWTWYGCVRLHPHPLTGKVRDEGDLKVSVGASLTLPARATPLLSGRDAFSDPGDLLNSAGAYLGNMAHDRYEPKGDLFLAAEAPYGRGKVLVFGDTSMFQRTNLSYTYDFVARLFVYLGVPGSATASWPVRLTGVLLLFLASTLLVLTLPNSLLAVAVVSSLAAFWLMGLDRTSVVNLPETPQRGSLAWVDLSHGNRVDIHAGRDDGIGGLNNHFWRQGYVPLGAKRFDPVMLEAAEVFVTVAPSFPYRPDERAALRSFVENGGLLIVASGFEERRGAEGLLNDYGYSIGGAPLGAAHESRAKLDSLDIIMKEAWPVRSPEGRGEVLIECWGFPLVVYEAIGQGGLIVIGDSQFLCDSRLEKSDSFVEQNIRFLRAAIELATSKERGGS